MFYNWQIKSSKNFPENHAVSGVFSKIDLGTSLALNIHF